MTVTGAPTYLTRFVGRRGERDRLAALIGEHRLVTVTGPGGMGKTRLAVETAAAAARPAAFCDLAPLAGDDSDGPGLALAAVPGEATLVVLDNCEHVIDACRSAVAAFLAERPATTVVATSREALGLEGEQVVVLPALEAESDAAALFLDRARLVVADYEPDAGTRAVIADLCRRVDGLPLAIELAAARLRLLAPAEMLDRLDERFRLLARPQSLSTASERHRTLEAAIDWSLDLLTDDERNLVRRLAVFPGAFDLDAAVTVGAPVVDSDVVDVLDGLVSKSILQSGRVGERTHFWLLESIRERARQWGEAAGDAEAARLAHLGWLVGRIEAIDTEQGAGTYRTFIGQLAALGPDCDLALATALSADGAEATAIELVGVLWHLWMNRGAIRSGRERAAAALARPGGTDTSRARAANAAANLDLLAGDADAARARYEEALRLRRAAGDQRGEVTTLNDLGVLGLRTGALEEARQWLEAAAALAEEVGDAQGSATANANLGGLLIALADLDGARAVLRRAVDDYDELGNDFGLAATNGNLASVLVQTKDLDGARDALLTAVAATARLDDRTLVAALVGIAAHLAEAEGDAEGAAAHLGALAAIRSRLGLAPEAGGVEGEEALRRQLQAELGPRRYADAFAAGGTRDDDEALAAVTGAPAPSAPVDADEQAEARLAREGPRWRITFRGRTATVPDSRGIDYLATLLARAGDEVGALELAGGGAALPADGDLGPILDGTAMASLRARLVQLGEDRERAERKGDVAALEAIDREVEAIADALGAGRDIRGRARRSGGDAERARKAVTNRIRHAVGVIESVDPDLAAHLRNSVRTGAFCAYHPERPQTWVVERA